MDVSSGTTDASASSRASAIGFERVDWYDLFTTVGEIMLSVFSIAGLIALWERHHTTKRLKSYVARYMESVEFQWHSQTDEFVLMHRVRSFELLLRRVQILQPRTPGAYKRVEAVRDILEYFHMEGVLIFEGEHLLLPTFAEFPVIPNDTTEAYVRDHITSGLRAIKWLGLKERAEQNEAA